MSAEEIIAAMTANKDDIVARWTEDLRKQGVVENLPIEAMSAMGSQWIDASVQFFSTGDTRPFEEFAEMVVSGASPAPLEVAIDKPLRSVYALRDIVASYMTGDLRDLTIRLFDDESVACVQTFSAASEKVMRMQSATIQELSTPVIQIWDDTLVLPLIGLIDTNRAQQIVETLLETIARTQATNAIMDITGVPVLDTSVANHLLKTIAAARMLGTEVIVTGVSPANAQTLVKLGLNLDQITTKSSLMAGLKLVFSRRETAHQTTP